MTYAEFLAACRDLAGERMGKEISRSAFAQMCSTPAKSYSAEYYRNMEEGYKPPGRELLEAAARVAGFEFEQCIQLPVNPTVKEDDRKALDLFSRALRDWRQAAALKAYADLATMKKPKRPKFGGRAKKH